MTAIPEPTSRPVASLPWRRFARVSAPGILVASLVFMASLTPSLVPRDPVTQGALAGAVAAIGYAVGATIVAIWRYLGLPDLPQRMRRRSLRATAAIAVVICAAGLALAARWQNVTRAVMDLPPVEGAHPLTIAWVAAATFLVLLLAGYLFLLLLVLVTRMLDRLLPPRLGLIVGVAIAVSLFWTVLNGTIVQRAMQAADQSFAAADALIDPEIAAPVAPDRAGGPGSVLEWDEMGRWGRSFVATGPSAAEIAEFAGPGAMDPVRVYVGRREAATPEERAQLALEELIRLGGFDRSTLIVTVPVGTGWMDPGGHDTVEFILGGDIATVAVQYSYLTSVLSIITNVEYGIDQARALFDAVYDHWTALPADARPRLYIHGLSQGSLNSQATLPLLDVLADPPNGALWAGSPFISSLWQHVRDNRQSGSPAWRPVFGNGSLARVMTQSPETGIDGADWGPIRLVFLHYGSDAIVNFTFDSAFRRPAWMTAPRAPDVPEGFVWVPMVTMFQLALDMAISLQVPGYGHFYIARDYIDAWALLLEPEGWNEARADELKAIFDRRAPPF